MFLLMTWYILFIRSHLQESLGGNAITLMFALVSPVDKAHTDNVNSLNLAQYAKAVKNKVKLNLVGLKLQYFNMSVHLMSKLYFFL